MTNYHSKINVDTSAKNAKRIRKALVKGYLRMMSDLVAKENGELR